MLDDLGKTISKIEGVQQNTVESQRAEKVVFIITTDGYENASREYSYEHIQKKIKDLQKNFGWEFIFLRANINAIDEAEKLGISSSRAANYCSDAKGTRLNYEVLSEAISSLRIHKTIDQDWKKKIDNDFSKRSQGI